MRRTCRTRVPDRVPELQVRSQITAHDSTVAAINSHRLAFSFSDVRLHEIFRKGCKRHFLLFRLVDARGPIVDDAESFQRGHFWQNERIANCRVQFGVRARRGPLVSCLARTSDVETCTTKKSYCVDDVVSKLEMTRERRRATRSSGGKKGAGQRKEERAKLSFVLRVRAKGGVQPAQGGLAARGLRPPEIGATDAGPPPPRPHPRGARPAAPTPTPPREVPDPCPALRSPIWPLLPMPSRAVGLLISLINNDHLLKLVALAHFVLRGFDRVNVSVQLLDGGRGRLRRPRPFLPLSRPPRRQTSCPPRGCCRPWNRRRLQRIPRSPGRPCTRRRSSSPYSNVAPAAASASASSSSLAPTSTESPSSRRADAAPHVEPWPRHHALARRYHIVCTVPYEGATSFSFPFSVTQCHLS